MTSTPIQQFIKTTLQISTRCVSLVKDLTQLELALAVSTLILFCVFLNLLHKLNLVMDKLANIEQMMVLQEALINDNFVDLQDDINSIFPQEPITRGRSKTRGPVQVPEIKSSSRLNANKNVGSILLGRTNGNFALDVDMNLELEFQDGSCKSIPIKQYDKLDSIVTITKGVKNKNIKTIRIAKRNVDDVNFEGVMVSVLNTENQTIRELVVLKDDSNVFEFKM